MSIEIKGIVCPQCGGTDIEMLTDTFGLCRMCGSQFAVHKYNSVGAVNTVEPEITTFRIHPEYSEADFLRKVWIELNEDDAPSEVFSNDFNEIKKVEYHVVMQTADVEGEYTVSIGYERQEPYFAKETIWEREGNRNIRRERIVTKNRNVTDWQAQSGTTGMCSIDCVDNDFSDTFDAALFKRSFVSSKDSSTQKTIPSESVIIRPDVYDTLHDYHELNLKDHLFHELPGDQKKDLSIHFTKQNNLETSVYIATEYRTSIRCGGHQYIRNAFPFGAMEISGDKIPNENSMWNNIRNERDTVPREIWKRTRMLSLSTIVLLVLSIIVNLFFHITALTIICFVVGIAAFIWNTIDVNRKTSAVELETDAAIAQYQTEYRAWRMELLNRKLISIGLAPVSDRKGGSLA